VPGRAPLFEGPARRRAVGTLDGVVTLFGRAGYRDVVRLGPLAARVSGAGDRRALAVELAPQGKVFGGTYALEVSTAEPVLPPTRGLSARGRGVVRTQGVAFHARRGDEAGRRLAHRLQGDRRLAELLGEVHFERIRVEPDGRPVVRHMGGSVVWIMFPPLVKAIPLVEDQVRATIAALEAF
jgi:hypothetical protein